MTRDLPHNVEAEAALLGAIIFDAAYHRQVVGILTPEDFYSVSHRNIYATASDLIAEGRPATHLAIVDALHAADLLAESGGTDYVLSLLDHAVFGPEVRDCALMVADLSMRRQLIAQAMGACEAAKSGKALSGLDTLSALEGDLVALRESASSSVTVVDAGEAVRAALENRDRRAADLIPTGLRNIDRVLRGVKRGTVTVIGGRPSMGKSALAIAIANNMAAANHTVGYFSLEMPADDVGVRAACAQAYRLGEPSPRYQDVLTGEERGSLMERVMGATRTPASKRLLIEDRGALRLPDLHATFFAWCQEAKRRNITRPSVVFVDHIGHLKMDGKRGRVEDTGAASKALLAFAKKYDVAVVCLVQLARDVGKEERMPSLHDLRWSGEIEEDAHAVLLLHRDEYYLERKRHENHERESERQMKLLQVRNQADINIAKNRNGSVDIVQVACSVRHNAFWCDEYRAQGEAA